MSSRIILYGVFHPSGSLFCREEVGMSGTAVSAIMLVGWGDGRGGGWGEGGNEREGGCL